MVGSDPKIYKTLGGFQHLESLRFVNKVKSIVTYMQPKSLKTFKAFQISGNCKLRGLYETTLAEAWLLEYYLAP